jgi:hypothetical protein
MNERSRAPEFHIAFDTNFVHNEVENRLLNRELSDLMLKTREFKHVRVSWYLLDIVRGERRYQMLGVAKKLIPHSERVGKLLGKDFGISLDGLKKGIDSVIEEEIKRHHLTVLVVDTAKVDWANIIECATNRAPPFEEGPKEKGFRDAIVMETFCQLVHKLSKTKRHTYIILLTGDRLLTSSVQDRLKGDNRVSVVEKLTSIQSRVNAFRSKLGEEHDIDLIIENANLLFYNKGAPESLFEVAKIGKHIRGKHRSLLSTRPSVAKTLEGSVKVTRITVGATTFMGEEKNCLMFETDINVWGRGSRRRWRRIGPHGSNISIPTSAPPA